jgi:hypothetical protein
VEGGLLAVVGVLLVLEETQVMVARAAEAAKAVRAVAHEATAAAAAAIRR